MRVLLDTCVLSENLRAGGEQRVKDRVRALDSGSTFISALTVGEIACGVAQLPPGKKKDHLEEFILGLQQEFDDRILPIDAETALIWGETTAQARSRGNTVPPTDGLIAATGLRHGLHVMTRNTDHFAPTGVLLINPWQDA